MHNYPIWGFPSFRRSYFPNYNYYRNNYYKSNNHNANNTINKSCDTSNNYNNNTKSSSFNFEDSFACSCSQKNTTKIDFSCNDNYYSDSEYFDVFGLKLHIDDLLILALIFFLYKEGIEDMYLYIALFLLLIN